MTSPAELLVPADALRDGLRLLRATLAEFDADPCLTRARVFRVASLLGVSLAPHDVSRQQTQPLTQRSAQAVVEYIKTHLEDTIRVPALAAIVGVSTSHFCRAFKAHFGKSTHRFIMDLRLRRAVDMMRTTDLPLIEIALASGMCDQSHLCNLFRRHYGESPNRWRRAQPAA